MAKEEKKTCYFCPDLPKGRVEGVPLCIDCRRHSQRLRQKHEHGRNLPMSAIDADSGWKYL